MPNKTFKVFAVSFSMIGYLLGQGISDRLEGCPDPAILARGLKALQLRKWVNLDPESVEKIMPVTLRGGEGKCEPQCVLLDGGRVIKNEIECGSSLRFQTSSGVNGLRMGLDTLVIRYSTRAREARDAAEKELKSALKMGADVKEDFGANTSAGRFRDFHWTDVEPERRWCSLRLEHGRVNTRWLLIFDLSCRPVEGTSTGK